MIYMYFSRIFYPNIKSASIKLLQNVMNRIAIRSFSPSSSLQTIMQNVTNRTAKRYVFAIIKLLALECASFLSS